MAVVWISNDAGHPDYEKAKKIAGDEAEIRALTLGDVNYLRLDRLNRELSRGIAKYVKPEDFLLFSGSIVVGSMALTLWILQHGRCRCLIWHGGKREYILNDVSRDHLEKQLEMALIGTNSYE